MNTKPIPAVLALISGFITCILSFIQKVDSVVFAKRFIIVCILFFFIGYIAKIIIDLNFKDMVDEETEEMKTDSEETEDETETKEVGEKEE